MPKPVCGTADQPAGQRAAAQPDSLLAPGRAGGGTGLRANTGRRVGWLFARCWRLAADPVYKLLFGALLFYTSVLELLLRLWQLAGRLYPGAVTLTSVCLLCVLPVVYLRRVSALSQTAHAVLCLLVLALP